MTYSSCTCISGMIPPSCATFCALSLTWQISDMMVAALDWTMSWFSERRPINVLMELVAAIAFLTSSSLHGVSQWSVNFAEEENSVYYDNFAEEENSVL